MIQDWADTEKINTLVDSLGTVNKENFVWGQTLSGMRKENPREQVELEEIVLH